MKSDQPVGPAPDAEPINWHDVVAALRARGIAFDRGLLQQEIVAAEQRFEFRFPPDLRALLEIGLPRGDKFPDWRSGDEKELQGRMDWPVDSMCFDIQHDDFWLEQWGPRPMALEAAFGVAREAVKAAPRLIPIFAHRYIPDRPNTAGNPVFSVWQTDVIYYGFDLTDYLAREFGIHNPQRRPSHPRTIDFWDLVVS